MVEQNWLVMYQMVQRFVDTHQRLPKDRAGEDVMYKWFLTYNSLYKKGLLFGYQKQLFENLINGKPHSKQQDKTQIKEEIKAGNTQSELWEKKLVEVENFIKFNNRMPSSRGCETPLYNWIKRNATLLDESRLSKERVDRFKPIYDFYVSNGIEANWNNKCEEAVKFFNDYHRAPICDADEMELYQWIYRNKKLFETNKLDDNKSKEFAKVDELIRVFRR